MIDEKLKAWIDQASYDELFARWRFAPVGDPFFQDEAGEYYKEVLTSRREEVGPEEHTAISKRLG